MDFYAEQEKRKQKALVEIGKLVDEYYQVSHGIKIGEKRLEEIDKLIAEREVKVIEIDQSQRNFNTYLAVKEGALTLEDIKKGVEDAQKEEGQNA